MLFSYTLRLRNKEVVDSCKSEMTWGRAIGAGQDSVRSIFGAREDGYVIPLL